MNVKNVETEPWALNRLMFIVLIAIVDIVDKQCPNAH